MAENEQPEVPVEAPDANLRAAIDGLDELSSILQQALADDDALVAGTTAGAAVPTESAGATAQTEGAGATEGAGGGSAGDGSAR